MIRAALIILTNRGWHRGDKNGDGLPILCAKQGDCCLFFNQSYGF